MKRSIIITGLMGLLLAGQPVQAANKMSSVRVGFLQKEYNAKGTTSERKAQILAQLNTGGYPAVAKQLQSGAQPAPTKEKPVAEIKKEQQELSAVKQEVNKKLADAAKEQKALAEKQAKEREEEAKKIAALEAERKRLEQQQGKEEEAAKKNVELVAAKQKQLEDEQRREEEIKKATAEQQRLEDEQEALKKHEEVLRKEALAREELAAILTAGETKLKELKNQLADATTVRDCELVMQGLARFLSKDIKKMPGFTSHENTQEIKALNSKFNDAHRAAEAKKDEIQKAAGKEKEEEEVKKPKELPTTPKQLSEEIARVQQELKDKTDAQKRAFLSKQMFDLKEKGKGGTALYKAYEAEYNKLGGGKIKEAQEEAKHKAEEAKKERIKEAERLGKEREKKTTTELEAMLAQKNDPKTRLDTLLKKAKESAVGEIEQQKAQYLAVKKEIARINGIVEQNAQEFAKTNWNKPSDVMSTGGDDPSNYVLIDKPFFTSPNFGYEYAYYQLLVTENEKFYNTPNVGNANDWLGSANKQPTYTLKERYFTSGPESKDINGNKLTQTKLVGN